MGKSPERNRTASQPKPLDRRTRVLFVCVGNSCRSQMAEALARHLAADVIEPLSAGIAPLGRIAKPTLAILEERGVRTDGQYSKPLTQEASQAADLIVNMTGLPGHPVSRGSNAPVEDWLIEDPYGEDLEIHRRIRNEVEERVTELAERLRRQSKQSRKA